MTSLETKPVHEGENVTLNCTADGHPAPNITWRRLSDNNDVTMPLKNISRHYRGSYRCTADNGIAPTATKVVFIDVQCEC